MIDFIKFRFNDYHLIKDQVFDNKANLSLMGKFDYIIDKDTYPIRGKLKTLDINITKKSAYLSNSLHKYWNSTNGLGVQNHNDFSFLGINACIDRLEKELGHDLSNTTLTNLEFGLNLDLGKICPTQFIDSNVLFYKLKLPCFAPKNKQKMKINSFNYKRYSLKIYNKSLQYGLEKQNLLRVEIKYLSKMEFNKFGIYNVKDLCKIEAQRELFKDLISKYDDLVIVDSYDGNSSMEKKDRELLLRFTNPGYWIETNNNCHPNTKTNRKKCFNKLIKDNNLDKWKIEIRNALIEKFEFLTTNCIVNNSDNILGKHSHILPSIKNVA